MKYVNVTPGNSHLLWGLWINGIKLGKKVPGLEALIPTGNPP